MNYNNFLNRLGFGQEKGSILGENLWWNNFLHLFKRHWNF